MSNVGMVSFSRTAQDLMKLRQVSEKEQASFARILENAESTRPKQAKETLRSLSLEDRHLLEKVHFGSALQSSLETPDQIDSLSDEGAYNLLVQPHGYVDVNGDGITNVGKGKTLIFPPSDSPQAVKDAWDAATEGLSPLQKATQELKMHIRLFGIVHDDVPTPKAPRGVSGYREAIGNQLLFLERNRGRIPSDIYFRDRDFLSRFLSALSEGIE
ncbi:MAG TPA: hypothetical protein DD435_08895 [Cyanobacteria bacterium UBA8530]|nr:hypothetical protein [Cyanobacteria bacterium UBA8530]